MAKEELSQLEKDTSYIGLREEFEDQEDPRMTLAEIVVHIQKNLKQMRSQLETQTKGLRKAKKRHQESRAEEKATVATHKRVEDQGKKGESDVQEIQQPPEQRKLEIITELTNQGVTELQAEQLASETIGRGFKYTKAIANIQSPVFFDVVSKGGSIIVSINGLHPAYRHLVELLEENPDNATEDELRSRLLNAQQGLE
jgi:Zn-dependent metalloprotease